LLAIGGGVYLYIKSAKKKKRDEAMKQSEQDGQMPDFVKKGQ
jgi:hypothetical protein